MRRSVAVLAASLCLAAAPAHAEPATLLPHVAGPDVPARTAPVATMTVFDRAPFFFGKGGALERTVHVQVPKATWRRAVLEFTDTPSANEPWDRVFAFSAAGVELLRGTTPRTAMTIHKDVTEYAALLEPGTKVPFTAMVGTYVGSHRVTARIAFYAEDPPAPAYARVVPAIRTFGIEPGHADKTRHTAKGLARFPRTPPKSAVVELTTTGHLPEGEFWYLPGGSTTPPVLRVRVDGVEVATARAMPYVYALAGFQNANDDLHPVMWWTAHQALDQAGVHTGVGEIPSYRASLPAGVAASLAGNRKVEVALEGKGLWITSVAFLLG
jgi:hypothetical protein